MLKDADKPSVPTEEVDLPTLQRALAQGTEACRTCRLMLMGPGRVGKTRWGQGPDRQQQQQ